MRDFALNEKISTQFEQAVSLLAKWTDHGGIYGLTGSAHAFLIATAVRIGAGPILYVLPNGEAASAAAADIRFFLGRAESEEDPLGDEVLLYPSSDAVPYSTTAFDTDVSISRTAALYRLSEATPPRVLVVGLDALARRVVPRSDLCRGSFLLGVGDEIDRDDLMQRLAAAGYRRSPLVEEPGDFAVRGFVVDLFPPLYQCPLRLEEMGDRIESIRFFDPSNQRSMQEVATAQIGPVHMLIPDMESLERGLEVLRNVCDERGLEKKTRQRLLDDFRYGVRFPGSEFYLPYFFASPQSVFDYLPRDCTLILPDHDSLVRAFEDVEDDILRGWESASKQLLPVPSPDKVYLQRDEFFGRAKDFRALTMSPLQTEEAGRIGIRVPCESNSDVREALLKAATHDSGMASLVKTLQGWRDNGNEIFIVSHTRGQALRLLKLLEPYDLYVDFRGEGFESSNLIGVPTPGIRMYMGALSAGFRLEQSQRVVLTEEEIFGTRVKMGRRLRYRGGLISSLNDLVEGEAVVHEDYGIGIFRGLARKEFDGIAGEVMIIEYAGGDILYHPVVRLHVIQKYISGTEGPPRIDRLGGNAWSKTKAKVKRSIKEMAEELLAIYARRQVSTRKPYSAPDENLAAFEASFEFEETPDQAKAIQDLMEGMDLDRPMDRLVCGDVGYGKTEVALRGAFRAIMEGKQVAILVPTTVLAQQHYDTVVRRFNGYPINADMLSRFRSQAEQKNIVRRLAEGKLDLVVGTHRLLSKDVVFRDLGMLVVDEEHRFGVSHKEKIKKFKTHVDVLTLTATPIPRTLHLSLAGIRDLSVIETPPANRKSIRTYVMRQSDEVIREALLRELGRGGQVFYLHNRVQTIHRRATALQRLVPEGSFGVAHGQMPERQLEQVMYDFVQGKFNILVCTSIIESGLDIPRANTIIIERADTFGLADLYQLRGRVGRSTVRAYAYLLTPPESLITPDAIKRLAVVQEHSDLGQGFRIAMRDLQIRGAGNILGTAQSGHVALVGYEMYLELLEEAVRQLNGEQRPPEIDPEIRLGIEVLIPEEYVPDQRQRMSLYKRLSSAATNAEIDEIEEEILDRYGKPPIQVENLVTMMRLRLAMKKLRILRMDYNGRDLALSFDSETPVRPEILISWAQKSMGSIRFLPGDRVSWEIGKCDTESRISNSFRLLESLKEALIPQIQLYQVHGK